MLQHEEERQADVPAAQARVTAEEFARAVARCQARREEAAQHLEGTVTIGEAVRELGLEATPEEILEEVQASRDRRARQGPWRLRRRFAWAGGGALGLLLWGLWLTAFDHAPPPDNMPRRSWFPSRRGRHP